MTVRESSNSAEFDLFIIGGGVNGCGIARDAAGRGLRVLLVEKGDLASGASSASTKLIHGGLRYLEFLELRLVREGLREREILLRSMPHIAWPLRFVLPVDPDLRTSADSPAARILARCMPWLKGRRPAWMIRLGLLIYDSLGGRKLLPGTTRLRLSGTAEGQPLKTRYQTAYEYSDCWVQDSRLVVLNAAMQPPAAPELKAAQGSLARTGTRTGGASGFPRRTEPSRASPHTPW